MAGQVAALSEVKPEHVASRYADVSAFARSVLSLLERTEYRRCDSSEDMEDIYRLRYRAYRSNGMVPQNRRGIIHDDLDDCPNSFSFGVYIDQRLVSTLRLHHVTATNRKSPSTSAFGDIVDPMIDAGRTFIDPSRFAADPDWTKDFPQIPYITLRLAITASMHFDVDDCLITIREDHASFYRRIFGAAVLSESRSYPGVYNMVQLFHSRLDVNLEPTLRRYPFFRSTPVERRMMFAGSRAGKPCALTILPTAKYFVPVAA